MFKKSDIAFLAVVLIVLISLFLSACDGNNGTTAASCPSVSVLNGAGATFVNPLFSQMFAPYGYPKAKCGTNIIYDSIGSGKGIDLLLANRVDFGATSAPLTEEQLTKSTSGNIIHVPVTIGAVAIAYNVNLKDDTGKAFTEHLNLTPAILASIYLGTITSWDDAAIKAVNPHVVLPQQNIVVLHGTDGTGTTFIFTDYLSRTDATWSSKVGRGPTVDWPVGVPTTGASAGFAAAVQNTAWSIGYVELEYVLSNGLSYAAISNANGKNVVPSLDGAKEAAIGGINIPDDLRFSIVNAPGDASYPISAFAWVIVYQHQSDVNKGQAIANMLWWMIHKGQQYSAPLSYAPLPAPIVSKAEAQIKSMTCGANKAPCYTGTAS